MEKIEAWKTDDGKVWETETAAEMHEVRRKAVDSIRTIYYDTIIDCDNDLIEFLDDYRLTILNFYGVTEN